MKHTPGPWELVLKKHTADVLESWEVRLDDYHISLYPYKTVHSRNGTHSGITLDDRKMADARLIAAAPDLLAVCKELIECLEYWIEYDVPVRVEDRLRAAVELAGGAE
jgi:hypothetical protein